MGTETGRRQTDGGEGWLGGGMQEQDEEERSQRRDLFLIDLPRSPRPLTQVIIRRIFELHSVWKECVISPTRWASDPREVYLLAPTYK